MLPVGHRDRREPRTDVDVKSAAKRILLEAMGWILVLVGIAALLLPGPGLLALFAGVALLATQYEWAERRLEPVKKAALRTAADSVRTWPRILMSSLGVMWLVALGIYWGYSPPAPSWWPIDDRWWLMGGWGTGATLVGSGIIAGVMVVYSYVHFRETRERHEEEPQPHP
jgi:uncharacterized protein (TIGR02611 family)